MLNFLSPSTKRNVTFHAWNYKNLSINDEMIWRLKVERKQQLKIYESYMSSTCVQSASERASEACMNEYFPSLAFSLLYYQCTKQIVRNLVRLYDSGVWGVWVSAHFT